MKKKSVKNVIDISYNRCFLTFRFDFALSYLFGGVYIKPENSKHFEPSMFADLDTLMCHCIECDYTPFIGGDFNTRFGDLNELSQSWHYNINVDLFSHSCQTYVKRIKYFL